MRKKQIQVLLLTGWSFLFLIPTLIRGTNIVTATFIEGTERFWSFASPYDTPKVADVFHYSPLFAFLYRPLTFLPSPGHALLWGLLNVFTFWLGVSAWWRFSKQMPKSFWLALALCAIELDISQRYQQINAMLVGFVLLSLHFYKKEKYVLSALLLSFITNIKLLPIVFLFSLFWPYRKKFILSTLGFSLLWIFLPALWLGLPKDIEFHLLQLQAIRSDTLGGHGGRAMLDFSSTLTRMGFGGLAQVLKWIMLGGFICGLWLSRLFEKQISFGIFYSFIMLSLLVLSPRTESPTFVFLAPAYLFVMDELKGVWKGLVPLFGFFISFVFTSVWAPHFTWTYHQHYYSKVVGTFLFFWVVFAIILRKTVLKPS